MLKNTCIETKMNKTRKPDKNQRINFQSCFHVVSLPVCTSSRRCIQSWKYLLQREPSHTAFWDTWQVFTVCLPVCLWTDIISKRQMFFHLIQALGYVLLLFLDCFVVGQLQREKIIMADLAIFMLFWHITLDKVH